MGTCKRRHGREGGTADWVLGAGCWVLGEAGADCFAGVMGLSVCLSVCLSACSWGVWLRKREREGRGGEGREIERAVIGWLGGRQAGRDVGAVKRWRIAWSSERLLYVEWIGVVVSTVSTVQYIHTYG